MGTEITSYIRRNLIEQGIVLDGGQQNALNALSDFVHDFLTRPLKKSFFSRQSVKGMGVYLHGDVGRGKTMLMDAVFQGLDFESKRRVHFHAFMKDVHEFLHSYRQGDRGSDTVDRALPEFADTIKSQCDIICFDEFHITDVADAMILSRLFTALLDKGIWMILTSNWQPDRLYEGGLQRDRIIPFIDLIKTQMDVVELDGKIDYRKTVLKGRPVYFVDSDQEFRAVVSGLTSGKEKQVDALTVKGRKIEVPESYGTVAMFSFEDLCARPLGAEDYLKIAQTYTVIVLTNIPFLPDEKRNEAKRFMVLIDVLYDKKCLLIAQAAANPDEIYTGHDHAFEFDRTVSRLLEMQSQGYLDALL